MYEYGPWLWAWIILAAALYVAEMFTAGFFMLPFALGATAAALPEFLGRSGRSWQWVAFLGVSVVAFLLLRRCADHITHEPPVKTGIDRLTGIRASSSKSSPRTVPWAGSHHARGVAGGRARARHRGCWH